MMKTMAVVIKVSRRLGHVTFCASARTSCMNLKGLIRAISIAAAPLPPRLKSDELRFLPSLLCLAGVEGLEPPTPGFGDRCSDQLSYTPMP
jgi:hypothetical protein